MGVAGTDAVEFKSSSFCRVHHALDEELLQVMAKSDPSC
jgi:hypothetical protein